VRWPVLFTPAGARHRHDTPHTPCGLGLFGGLRADITTHTAGWLVARTARTMAGVARIDDRLARLNDRSSRDIPPAARAGP
jgi:hypothetical protein